MIREGIIVCDRKEELYFSYARIKKIRISFNKNYNSNASSNNVILIIKNFLLDSLTLIY